MRRYLSALLCAAVVLAVGTVTESPASASPTFTVTVTADAPDAHPGDGRCASTLASHACTLRAAVMEANTVSTAAVRLPAGTFTLNGEGDLPVSHQLSVSGAGARRTIVDGSGLTSEDSLFYVDNPGTLAANDLTLTNGKGFYGGNIYNLGAVVLRNAAVTHGRSVFGGGIFNAADLTVTDSTIFGNTGDNGGGGIFSQAPRGTLVRTQVDLSNVTISGNQTNRAGGGIYLGGAGYFKNDTITQNTANANRDVTYYNGGGIAIYDGPSDTGDIEQIDDTLILGNTDNQTPGTGEPDCINGDGTPITSLGYNILGSSASCSLHGTSDQSGTLTAPIDPASVLSPTLANNGGETDTFLPVRYGPAVDTGSPVDIATNPQYACARQDQRGQNRPQAGNGGAAVCDRGAVELQPYPEMTMHSTSGKEGTGTHHRQLSFPVTLSHPTSDEVTVSYFTTDGTAKAGKDYQAVSGTLKFPPRTTALHILVPLIPDSIKEPNETFTVTLEKPVDAVLTKATGTGTIINDDQAP